MSVLDLIRIDARCGDRRLIAGLRKRTVEAVVIIGLLDHSDLEGLDRSEAFFLVASLRNDLDNARSALTRLAALHDGEADLKGPERSEGPYVARSTQNLERTREDAYQDTLHTTPANRHNFFLEAEGFAPEGGPDLAGSGR